jgi:hypothetical protein
VYQNNKLILKKNLYQISSKGLFVTLVWWFWISIQNEYMFK